MRIVMREACRDRDKGSMGAQYVMWAVRAAGYTVDYETDGWYDVELVSVHHVTDYPRVRWMTRRGRVRIVGGHPCAVNPRPIIAFCDAVCVGEGESWIGPALDRLSARLNPRDMADLPGTIVSNMWSGDCTVPLPNIEPRVPDHPAYLNKAADGHAAAWYLEMARGCPHKCAYCELGNTLPYRVRGTHELRTRV